MSRILVLAGGSPHAHDFASIGSALVDRIEAAGHLSELSDNPDDAACALIERKFDVLVIAGLWWQMRGEAYDQWRDDHQYQTPPSTGAAIAGFVSGGGGVVALHTAPVCFDDWPQWGDILGASWNWDSSSHPPYGMVRATVAAEHPIVAGIGSSIELHDEIYGGLDLRGDMTVLATARRHDGDPDQPVLWTRRYGQGRVVFNGFGHNADSIHHHQNGRIIDQSIAWVS